MGGISSHSRASRVSSSSRSLLSTEPSRRSAAPIMGTSLLLPSRRLSGLNMSSSSLPASCTAADGGVALTRANFLILIARGASAPRRSIPAASLFCLFAGVLSSCCAWRRRRSQEIGQLEHCSLIPTCSSEVCNCLPSSRSDLTSGLHCSTQQERTPERALFALGGVPCFFSQGGKGGKGGQ